MKISFPVRGASSTPYFFLIFFFLFLGCNPQKNIPVPEIYEIKGEVFGSYYIVKYRGELEATDFLKELDVFFKDFNDKFSTYQSDSIISTFNRAPIYEKIKTTSDFISMMKFSKELHQKTQGAFDPTLGPVIKAWGFGGGERKGAPSEDVLKEARRKVGMEYVKWDEKTTEIWKTRRGVQLDVNSFAPGWAGDIIGQMLEKHGVINYMVDISGEILLKGERSEGAPWRIGIERPSLKYAQGVQAVLALKDQAISTSGNYRQFYDDQGQRRSHIIDPRTGKPVSHTISSATVIAANAALADAWSTAIMVLGKEGIELAEKNGIWVYLLEAQKPDEFTDIISPSMQKLLEQK